MGTTDANGIYFYEDTDPVSPLHTLLNRGQTSVSNLLGNKILPQIVLNQAARDTLAASFAPRVDKPLYVHRQDTGRFERSIGSGFEVINPIRSGGITSAASNVNGIVPVTHGLGRVPTRMTVVGVNGAPPAGNAALENIAFVSDYVVWFYDASVIHFRARRLDSLAWFGGQPLVFSWTAE